MVLLKIIKSFLSIVLMIIMIIYIESDNILAKEVKKNDKKQISIFINNKQLKNLKMPPIILNGNTLIPARDVFEPLGAFVDWNFDKKEIYVAYKDDIIILSIDKNIAFVNNNIVYMSIEPKIINDKTMIPVRFVAESLGFDVKWDGKNNSININNTSTSNDMFTTIEDLKPPVVDDNILNEENNKIKIKNLIIPKKNEKNVFQIETDKEIDKIENFIENNKLIIDIYNAELNMKNKNYNVFNNFVVENIKFNKIELDSKKVIRLEFDLKIMTDYLVKLSNDKKCIEINFMENKIKNIVLNKDSNSDYIFIEGSISPNIDIYIENNLLTIDIQNSTLENEILNTLSNGNYINNVNIVKNDNNVRIIANICRDIITSIANSDNELIIKIDQANYKNISYNKEMSRIVLCKNEYQKIDIDSIICIDDYKNKKYILTLPGDFMNTYGYGKIIVYNDNFLNSIDIENVNGNTNLILNENNILEVNLNEDIDNIYIKIISPKEKYSKILVLDPGHGGKDPGTSNISDKSIVEKNIVLDISNKVIDLMKKNENIKVYATRIDDTFVSLNDRVYLGNQVGDLFVSIHLNSTPINFAANGTETYYCDNVSDYNFNIRRKDIAKIFQNNIVEILGTKDRGIKPAQFLVLKNTNIPSILIELGFLTNDEEANKFNTDIFRQEAANAIYKSILETFNSL